MNYDIIGPFTVTSKDLKQRYRTLSKKFHPDAGGTAIEFNKLIELYENLLKNITNENLFTVSEDEKKIIPFCRECNGQGVDYDYFKGILVKTWLCPVCKGSGFSSYAEWNRWVGALKTY